MTTFADTGPALIAITFMVSLVMAIAWADFGRPRHALTWAIAFALLGLAWILGATEVRSEIESRWLDFFVLALGGISIGLNTLGFRQRTGNTLELSPFVTAVTVQIVATAVLLGLDCPASMAALPLYMLSAVMAWNASRMLVGRRKSERAAERFALICLRVLALLSIVLLATGLLNAFDSVSRNLLRFANFGPLLPAMITGIGLFIVFLLTADLADQSRRLAGTDMLTGLLNRRGFEEAAKALIGSAQRNNRDVCLALIDIDRFKVINDRFGHLAGDEVLRRFARSLARHVGQRDILARVGGEEFALMLADRDCDAALQLLEAMRGDVERCALGLPGDHHISASFGLASLGPAYDLAGLYAEADRAVYQAKENGRNQVIVA